MVYGNGAGTDYVFAVWCIDNDIVITTISFPKLHHESVTLRDEADSYPVAIYVFCGVRRLDWRKD